jgi:5'-nucleotidase
MKKSKISALPAVPIVPQSDKLVIGISSRALFDLEKEHELFEQKGVRAYCQHMVDHEKDVLKPGVALHLAKSFLNINKECGKELVEICVLSRNNADTSLRLFNSFDAHGLNIKRVALTGGESISPYLEAFRVNLFLSANPASAFRALKAGVAAALVYPESKIEGKPGDSIRIALDGDGVLFGMEAENVFRSQGLAAFDTHEKKHAEVALSEGPMAKFLKKLSALQIEMEEHSALLKTALITARGHPSHERAIKTLRTWNVKVDAAFFMSGAPKTAIVKAFGADIFFDNQENHCKAVSSVAPTAQVLETHGNEAPPEQ